MADGKLEYFPDSSTKHLRLQLNQGSEVVEVEAVFVAEGGMGRVYLANIDGGKKIIIKRFDRNYGIVTELTANGFTLEGIINHARKVSHELEQLTTRGNYALIDDSIQLPEGFIAVEFAEGKDLAELSLELKARPDGMKDFLNIMDTIRSIIETQHQSGIFNLDVFNNVRVFEVSPGVFQIKIFDFDQVIIKREGEEVVEPQLLKGANYGKPRVVHPITGKSAVVDLYDADPRIIQDVEDFALVAWTFQLLTERFHYLSMTLKESGFDDDSRRKAGLGHPMMYFAAATKNANKGFLSYATFLDSVKEWNSGLSEAQIGQMYLLFKFRLSAIYMQQDIAEDIAELKSEADAFFAEGRFMTTAEFFDLLVAIFSGDVEALNNWLKSSKYWVYTGTNSQEAQPEESEPESAPEEDQSQDKGEEDSRPKGIWGWLKRGKK